MTAAPRYPSRPVVVGATRNPDKLRPLAEIVGDRFQLVPLPDGIVVDEPDLRSRPEWLSGPEHPAASRPRALPGAEGTGLRNGAKRSGRSWQAMSPSGAGMAGPAEEPSQDLLVAIASLKAIAASSALPGQLAIASDGGLLIPALGTAWSPARTRRFAGPDATNADRITALLALTADLRADERRIGWREAVAVARDGRLLLTAAAESAPGWLALGPPMEAPSSQGFWLPTVWRNGPNPDALPGAAGGHWERLAALVPPALSGLAARSVGTWLALSAPTTPQRAEEAQ